MSHVSSWSWVVTRSDRGIWKPVTFALGIGVGRAVIDGHGEIFSCDGNTDGTSHVLM